MPPFCVDGFELFAKAVARRLVACQFRFQVHGNQIAADEPAARSYQAPLLRICLRLLLLPLLLGLPERTGPLRRRARVAPAPRPPGTAGRLASERVAGRGALVARGGGRRRGAAAREPVESERDEAEGRAPAPAHLGRAGELGGTGRLLRGRLLGARGRRAHQLDAGRGQTAPTRVEAREGRLCVLFDALPLLLLVHLLLRRLLLLHGGPANELLLIATAGQNERFNLLVISAENDGLNIEMALICSDLHSHSQPWIHIQNNL